MTTALTTGYVSFSEIDKLLANREPLFIRNRSAKPTRILVINYPSAEGELSFSIPRITIPFNICDYVDPESLRASRSFRAMLNTGNVEVVKEEDARRELGDPERIKAFRLAYDEANNTYKARAGESEKSRTANQAVRDENLKSQSGAMKNMLASMDPTLAKALNIVGEDGQRPAPKLIQERSARLTSLEARVKNKLVDEAGIMSELSLMLGELTQEEFEFLASHPAFPPGAQQWARDRLAFAIKAGLV
jgi:hypothetical protein